MKPTLLKAEMVPMESRFGWLLKMMFTNAKNERKYAAMGLQEGAFMPNVCTDLRDLADALEKECEKT
jgi:hypothetical protein